MNGDWMLFLSRGPEPRVTPEPAAVESWVVLRRELGMRGFGLLVLFIPGKDVVYSGSLAEPFPVRTARATPVIAAALSARGVPVLDLAPRLRAGAAEAFSEGRYLYWRDDTHWNPTGVRIAAAALSGALVGVRPLEGAGSDGGGPAGPFPHRSTRR